MNYQIIFIKLFHTDQKSESSRVMFVSLVLGDSAYSSQVCLLKFLMCIYVLAKTYLDWMTTEHTFERPKGKWWSWSGRMMQLSSAHHCILCFPKARWRGLAQVCRVGVWRCKKALNNLCIPVLPRCSNKVNIIGICFPSSFLPLLFPLLLLHSSPFLLHPSPPWDHCVGWCSTLCLWFAHLSLWVCTVVWQTGFCYPGLA